MADKDFPDVTKYKLVGRRESTSSDEGCAYRIAGRREAGADDQTQPGKGANTFLFLSTSKVRIGGITTYKTVRVPLISGKKEKKKALFRGFFVMVVWGPLNVELGRLF